jgi:hypothetical protein
VSGRHEELIPPDPTRRGAAAPRFDHLDAEAYAIAGDPAGAVRLLVLRLLQRRPEDALARAAADAVTRGAWGRIERRARGALGPGAPPSRVAAWMARTMGLDGR